MKLLAPIIYNPLAVYFYSNSTSSCTFIKGAAYVLNEMTTVAKQIYNVGKKFMTLVIYINDFTARLIKI